MTDAGQHHPHRARSEQAALEHVVERLSRQFPDLPHEAISNAVLGKYDEFGDSTIRDFLPILVERAARTKLTSSPPRYRA